MGKSIIVALHPKINVRWRAPVAEIKAIDETRRFEVARFAI